MKKEKTIYVCLNCGVSFTDSRNRVRVVCSRACNDFWKGEKNHKWKGDKVGYAALHAWITSQLGRPKKCEDCGSTRKKRYEWANISGKYKRDLKDWRRLCSPCHSKFDGHAHRAWSTKHSKV